MIDSHMHFTLDLGMEAMMQTISDLEGAALLSIPKAMKRPANQDVLAFQKACLEAGIATRIYVFGGMPPAVYDLPAKDISRALVETTDELMREGCCGIKILEGKPNAKKDWHVPDFDSEVWEPFWAKAESEHIPIIMHVNDPEEFWHTPGNISPEELAFRVRSGWMYDSSFPDNEDQYRQMMIVLQRHPQLTILFPHFFFLSRQLERLSAIFDQYPNVMTDVTPGIELFLNLSDHIEEARRFFGKYADRICYGTDIGARQVIHPEVAPLNMAETASRVRLVRTFIKSQQDYILQPDDYYRGPKPHRMHALKLTGEEQELIFGKNFLRFIGRHHKNG